MYFFAFLMTVFAFKSVNYDLFATSNNLEPRENQMADSSSKVEMELDFAADFVMPSTVQAPRSSRAALTDEDGEEAGAFCTNQTFKSWRARTQLAAELETYRCYRTQICKLYRDK